MQDTMRDAPGVGLAAPQVGESLQIAVIEDKAKYQKGLTAEQLSERQRFPVDFK
jgi:peptide deformylase